MCIKCLQFTTNLWQPQEERKTYVWRGAGGQKKQELIIKKNENVNKPTVLDQQYLAQQGSTKVHIRVFRFGELKMTVLGITSSSLIKGGLGFTFYSILHSFSDKALCITSIKLLNYIVSPEHQPSRTQSLYSFQCNDVLHIDLWYLHIQQYLPTTIFLGCSDVDLDLRPGLD